MGIDRNVRTLVHVSSASIKHVSDWFKQEEELAHDITE